MKTSILLLAFTAVMISSCTTAYKTGQTPDDVYFSPAKPQDEYVKTEINDERKYRYDDDYYDDRYLRMKVRNRYRWSELDNWYFYDRYSIGYNYYFGSFNNPFNSWHYYYNPYCCCLNNFNFVAINPNIQATPPVVKRQFNLAGYTTTTSNNNNSGMVKTKTTTTTRPVYNNTNNNNNNNRNSSLSDKVRSIFSNDNPGSGSSRTYNPSSSGSSGGSPSGSSSGTGSAGGGISRPGRN